MKFRSLTTGFALAVVAVLGASGPAAAGDLVPFHGRLVGDVTNPPLDPPVVFPHLSVLVEATGQATRLGRFTLEFPHIVDLRDSSAIGTYTFTAANGDTLTADVVGQGTPTGTPGVFYIVEVATITGGTGRFAGATGSFTVERLSDRIAGTTVGSFEGTISSRGAGKR